jgi:hypothetical protein
VSNQEQIEKAYQAWEDKQRAMGRKVPETTAPYFSEPVDMAGRTFEERNAEYEIGNSSDA